MCTQLGSVVPYKSHLCLHQISLPPCNQESVSKIPALAKLRFIQKWLEWVGWQTPKISSSDLMDLERVLCRCDHGTLWECVCVHVHMGVQGAHPYDACGGEGRKLVVLSFSPYSLETGSHPPPGLFQMCTQTCPAFYMGAETQTQILMLV